MAPTSALERHGGWLRVPSPTHLVLLRGLARAGYIVSWGESCDAPEPNRTAYVPGEDCTETARERIGSNGNEASCLKWLRTSYKCGRVDAGTPLARQCVAPSC